MKNFTRIGLSLIAACLAPPVMAQTDSNDPAPSEREQKESSRWETRRAELEKALKAVEEDLVHVWSKAREEFNEHGGEALEKLNEAIERLQRELEEEGWIRKRSEVDAEAAAVQEPGEGERLEQVLWAIVEGDDDVKVRMEALKALGSPQNQRQIDRLKKLALDKNTHKDVRHRALELMLKARTEPAAKALLEVYEATTDRHIKLVLLQQVKVVPQKPEPKPGKPIEVVDVAVQEGQVPNSWIEKLVEIATQGDDPELRSMAISRLGKAAKERE